jgi:cobalt/nickel transport system permease protein
MHIPDGFLAPQVALILWVATVVVIGVALRQIGNRRGARSRTVLMGISGAFIFAAQMFNFPVAAGTSGHLLGGVLAGFLLGPWAGSVVMATVIGIQALLFQDGGLLALGANIFNMGVIGTLGGTFIARGISSALGGARIASLFGVGAAAWLSVVIAAGFTTLQLGLSGTTDIGIGLPAMLGTHALIGIGEALISVAALGLVAASAPEILRVSESNDVVTAPSLARRIGAAAGVIITVVVCASLFASASPDGLEKVATDLGFLSKSSAAPFELFADYRVPGLEGPIATIVAGLVGVLVVAGLLIALSSIATRRRMD